MSPLRRNIMLGTAGHVDHGKTAVVKLLTGCDTDTLSEEKQRGLTIDLGFAPCHLANDRIVGVVDVPGHVDFIRNMVAGAHGIDVVILVVAADDGIMPQTREHLHILRLMGLRHGLVALTKIDLVDPARRVEAAEATRRLLQGTFLDTAPICPLSALSGEGFEAFFDALNKVADRCADRPVGGSFHLWIEDVFTIRGAGVVVTGIPTRGCTHVGERLTALPGDVVGRIRGLQVYGEPAEVGRAGECIALNLAEVNHPELQRGMVLCQPDTLEPVSIIEADLELLADLPAELKDNAEVRLHIGTAAQTAHVALLSQPTLQPGEHQFAQLRFAHPLGIVPGERFVIRAPMPGDASCGVVTLGGGRVLAISNTRLRRRKACVLQRLTDRRDAIGDPIRWADTVLREPGEAVSLERFAHECQLQPAEAELLLRNLGATGRATTLPDGRWVHAETLTHLGRELLRRISDFHDAHPQHEGLSRTSVQPSITPDSILFDLAVTTAVRRGLIQERSSILSCPKWQARLAPEQERQAERLAATLQHAGWNPPTPAELSTRFSLPLNEILTLTGLLAERGVLVRLAESHYLHRDAVAAAKRVALRLFARAPAFSTMEFRDALSVSRKYAVPLLDHLDSIRFTVRSGNQRTPGVEARQALKEDRHRE